MKARSKVFLIIFMMASIILSLFSFVACKGNEEGVFYGYTFSLESGTFEKNDEYLSLSVSDDKKTCKLYGNFSEGSVQASFEMGSDIILDNGWKIYISDYFVTLDQDVVGRTHFSASGDFEGEVTFFGENLTFTKGMMLSQTGETVGFYEKDNTFVTINYNGEKSSFLLFKVTEGKSSHFLMVKNFYSSTKFSHKKVENTGFDVPYDIITSKSGKIDLVYNREGYKPKSISYEIIKENCEFKIREDGSYTLSPQKLKNEVILKITVDGVTKIVNLSPVSIGFDKAILVMRYTGESISFNSPFYFSYFGADFGRFDYKIKIAQGDDVAVLTDDKTVLFIKSGTVVLKLEATYIYGGKTLEITDTVSINVGEK